MSDVSIGIFFLLLAALSAALGQALFKLAALNGSLAGALTRGRRILVLGILCFGVEGVFWTLVLRRLDLSLAQPLASVELIAVALFCHWWLKEELKPRRRLGIVFIVVGIVLVGAV